VTPNSMTILQSASHLSQSQDISNPFKLKFNVKHAPDSRQNYTQVFNIPDDQCDL